jgi:hypothetical protein
MQVFALAEVCVPDFLSASSSILDSTENTSSFDTGNRGTQKHKGNTMLKSVLPRADARMYVI